MFGANWRRAKFLAKSLRGSRNKRHIPVVANRVRCATEAAKTLAG
jgi:hypothetical protein